MAGTGSEGGLCWGDGDEDKFLGVKSADMDGDRKQEVSIAFPKRVLVAKFEDGRWHTGWVEVPFVWYKPVRGFLRLPLWRAGMGNLSGQGQSSLHRDSIGR